VLAEVAAAAIELLMAYTVAEISWRFIETPILKLKRHFETRAADPERAASALARPATQSATAG
jgi:peptidoglycan/LPS O-acetylase OafA/YrhL